MSRKKKSPQDLTTAKTPSPPPEGFDSWEAFRAEIWNAGLEQPGTRAFKIVGDELHEITREEALMRRETKSVDNGSPDRPTELKLAPGADPVIDGAHQVSTDDVGKSNCGDVSTGPSAGQQPIATGEQADPWFWEGRLRTEGEMTGIVYEVMRKALRYPVMAGCDLGWSLTQGKFPYDVAQLIIQEGPIALEEFIRFDAETMSWYLWTMASTYIHFGPKRTHAVRERLRREAFEAIEQGTWTAVE